jgi:hypothetical protein
MPRDPNARTFTRLQKLHPNLVMAYLNADGRKVAIYKNSPLRMKRGKRPTPEFRYTVYGKNWKVVDASHEGFRNMKHLISRISLPAPMPPVPELGSGILWTNQARA